jgi:hypothetical protein
MGAVVAWLEELDRGWKGFRIMHSGSEVQINLNDPQAKLLEIPAQLGGGFDEKPDAWS